MTDKPLRCPKCGHSLRIAFGGSAIICRSCGASWVASGEAICEPLNAREDAVVSQIAYALRQVCEEGGQENFAIFEVDKKRNYYVQVAGSCGDPEIYGEAASNNLLTPQDALDEQQIDLLASLGWHPPSPNDLNFYQVWVASSKDAYQPVAYGILQTLIQVYGFSADQEISVNVTLE